MSRAEWLFASPPPNRIRKTLPSPCHSRIVPEIALPDNMPKVKYPEIAWEEHYLFFTTQLGSDFLDTAESRGFLWQYTYNKDHPYQRDEKALQSVSGICLAHLKKHAHGLFIKKCIKRALVEIERRTKRCFSTTVSLDLQAFYYCRFFSDVRCIKKNSTTGTRLPAYARLLVHTMQLSSECTQCMLYVYECVCIYIYIKLYMYIYIYV